MKHIVRIAVLTCALALAAGCVASVSNGATRSAAPAATAAPAKPAPASDVGDLPRQPIPGSPEWRARPRPPRALGPMVHRISTRPAHVMFYIPASWNHEPAEHDMRFVAPDRSGEISIAFRKRADVRRGAEHMAASLTGKMSSFHVEENTAHSQNGLDGWMIFGHGVRDDKPVSFAAFAFETPDGRVLLGAAQAAGAQTTGSRMCSIVDTFQPRAAL